MPSKDPVQRFEDVLENRIEISRVWLMVKDDPPTLKTAVQAALQRLRAGQI